MFEKCHKNLDQKHIFVVRTEREMPTKSSIITIYIKLGQCVDFVQQTQTPALSEHRQLKSISTFSSHFLSAGFTDGTFCSYYSSSSLPKLQMRFHSVGID